MKTLYDWLIEEINPDQIEKIELEANYIEYRIWQPTVIFKNERAYKFGKACKVKYLEDPNGNICFEQKRYIKDNKKELFTEDNEFYKQILKVNTNECIGLTSNELYDKVNKVN